MFVVRRPTPAADVRRSMLSICCRPLKGGDGGRHTWPMFRIAKHARARCPLCGWVPSNCAHHADTCSPCVGEETRDRVHRFTALSRKWDSRQRERVWSPAGGNFRKSGDNRAISSRKLH